MFDALTSAYFRAWYAKWPPERCEPEPVRHAFAWGEGCAATAAAHLCCLEGGHDSEHLCTCGARPEGAEVLVAALGAG